MEFDIGIIGIGIAVGVSWFILYTRKKKWANPKYIWLICIGLFSIGSIALLTQKTELKETMLMFYGFCVPLIYWIFDRFFKYLSIKIQKRDFILYLRNSEEINMGLFTENSHVKPLDIFFSFALVAIIVVSIFVGVYFI